jgi:hypothetical protein
LRGIPRPVLLRRQTDELQQLVYAVGGTRSIPSQQTWDDGYVLANRVMREQTTLLDDVAHVTAQVRAFELLGRGTVDIDDAGARVVEAVDQFEERRLAATGGADEDDELTRLDRQRDLDNGGTRLLPVVKPLGDVIEPDLGRCVGSAGERLLLVLDGAPPLARVEGSRSRVEGETANNGGCNYVVQLAPLDPSTPRLCQSAPEQPLLLEEGAGDVDRLQLLRTVDLPVQRRHDLVRQQRRDGVQGIGDARVGR